MAFKDIDRHLIDECCKDIVDFDKIKSLINNGADINALDDEWKNELYNEILDFYIFESRERHLNLDNLFQISKIFIENRLILNQTPEDGDGFLPNRFRFLPPEKVCVDTFKLLLENGKSSFEDLDCVMTNASLDLHLGTFSFFEQTNEYFKEDSIKYYLELIYWACAYCVEKYPEKCSKKLLSFNWFNRNDNKVILIQKNGSTSVFIENIKTHKRSEIDGWSMKHP